MDLSWAITFLESLDDKRSLPAQHSDTACHELPNSEPTVSEAHILVKVVLCMDVYKIVTLLLQNTLNQPMDSTKVETY
jgi:hypothetical protein